MLPLDGQPGQDGIGRKGDHGEGGEQGKAHGNSSSDRTAFRQDVERATGTIPCKARGNDRFEAKPTANAQGVSTWIRSYT